SPITHTDPLGLELQPSPQAPPPRPAPPRTTSPGSALGAGVLGLGSVLGAVLLILLSPKSLNEGEVVPVPRPRSRPFPDTPIMCVPNAEKQPGCYAQYLADTAFCGQYFT